MRDRHRHRRQFRRGRHRRGHRRLDPRAGVPWQPGGPAPDASAGQPCRHDAVCADARHAGSDHPFRQGYGDRARCDRRIRPGGPDHGLELRPAARDLHPLPSPNGCGHAFRRHPGADEQDTDAGAPTTGSSATITTAIADLVAAARGSLIRLSFRTSWTWWRKAAAAAILRDGSGD